MKKEPNKSEIDLMFAAHERRQILDIANNTTFDQRLRWLESALNLARSVAADRERLGLRTILNKD